MRTARTLWSNVYRNFESCGKSGTGRVPRKNAFRRVSRIRLITGMCLHAEGAPLGRFAPSCTRKVGLSQKNLRHSSESRLRGQRISLGRMDMETTHEDFLSTFSTHSRKS